MVGRFRASASYLGTRDAARSDARRRAYLLVAGPLVG